MENRRNYYRILHVQPDAPVEVIKASYRTMMKKLAQHPDLGGEHWNSALINEAKAVLTDPAKRVAYDHELMEIYDLSKLSGFCQGQQRYDQTGERVSPPEQYKPIIKSYCLFCKNPYRGDYHILPDTICPQCKSPLYPVKKMNTGESSQRAVARIEKQQEIGFFIYWPPQKRYLGQIQDLSPNGLLFLTDQQLSRDQIIKIDSKVLSATARVASCRKQGPGLKMGYGIGVEFVTLQFQRSQGTFVSMKA